MFRVGIGTFSCQAVAVEQRTVTVGEGIDLAVCEAGVGGAPLLLLHGFTGAKEDFGDWIDRLGDAGWHTVAPDHRGHGASSKPDDEAAYTFEAMAGDAFGLTDVLGWDRFVLLGHSMGGMVAQVMAVHAPERLRGLVLMDTHHAGIEAVEREVATLGAEIARAEGMDVLHALLSELSNPLDSPADARLRAERPGYAEFGDRKFLASSPAMFAGMLPAMVDAADRLTGLTALDVPTLVLAGEDDRGFLPASQRIAAAIPGAGFVCIPDAGHSPQFENPDAWWTAVTRFLGTIDHV